MIGRCLGCGEPLLPALVTAGKDRCRVCHDEEQLRDCVGRCQVVHSRHGRCVYAHSPHEGSHRGGDGVHWV